MKLINTYKIRLAALNATRKPARTLLTAGMVAAGTSMLVLSMSWIGGIFDDMLDIAAKASGHVRIVDSDFAEREQLMPMYENLPDTDALLARIEGVEGLVKAFPKISTGVTVSVGDEIGDVFGLAMGAPNEYFKDYMNAEDELVEGRWFDENKEELVLGYTVAERAGAKIGDEVILLGLTQDGSMSPIKGDLVGIVRAGNGLYDQGIFVSLERMRWLVDIPDGAIEVLIYGEDRDQSEQLGEALRVTLGGEDYVAGGGTLKAGEYNISSWHQRPPWAQMIPMVDAVNGALIFVFVMVVALGVWVTMMMSVLERTDEIGVMRAMGLTRWGAVSLFVGEATAIAVIGGILGVAFGCIPSWYLTVYGLELSEQLTQNMSADMPISTHIYAGLSLKIVITSFFMGIIMAVTGSLLPAWRASTIQPVVAMRTGH